MFFIQTIYSRWRGFSITLSPSPEKISSESIGAGDNSIDRFVRGTIDSLVTNAEKAKDVVTTTGDKFHDSLDRTLGSAERLGNVAVEASERAISTSVMNWLNDHPFLSWLFFHPLITVFVILVSLLLFSGLFRAIGSLSERFWVAIFLLPIKLSRGIFGTIARSSFQITETSDKQRRLAFILNRLEEIKREQDALLQEMAGILEIKPDRVKESTSDRVIS